MVFDAVSLHESGKLSMASFKKAIEGNDGRTPAGADSPAAREQGENQLAFAERLPTIEQAVHQLVEEAVRRAQGNQGVAAGMLGISRQALSKRLKKSSLDPA